MPPPVPPPSRTKPADVRREELMDAALALFIAKGVAATSIDEIVAAAGVSKGGLYHHFGSKDALLTALQDRYVAAFLAQIVSVDAAAAPLGWKARMDARIEACVEGFFANIAIHDVVFHEFKPVDRREMNENAFVDELTGFFTAGREAGAWRLGHPRLTAVMLFHAMHGACDEAILTPDAFDRRTLVETLQHLSWQSVYPND